ncbi:MAG TPA: cyclase family protein [Chitinophagaceae bacterium]|nr:cyclase family protein [Chitinophagaceae bacterium]
MKKVLYSVFILFVACSSRKEKEFSFSELTSSGKWIDLSYDFSDKTIYWPTAGGFRLDTAFNGVTPAGFYYSSYNFCASEHGGTHLDAPVHFAEGKWSVDQIPLENLVGNAVVIDVTEKALKDPDYLIIPNDIEDWEKKNGKIPDGSILFFRTGFGSFYPDTKKYLGTDERGADAVAKLHFPAIHPDAAEWLVKNRKIKAVGIDVASVDYGQSADFKTHQILYTQNISGFENVANLDKLPAKGAFVIALPVKIKGGSGGPLRIIARVPA